MFRTKCKEHDHSSFYQFLQMEHSYKNTDCYFFYYSTCKKGDECPFRHEPSALGCETMCIYWQQGKCLDEHCNYRHMELKKNRKAIPCYWEKQPSGCRKPHCSFMHSNARMITNNPINPVKNSELTPKSLSQEWLNLQDDAKYDGNSTESDQGRGSSEAGSFIGSTAVDPLIVKFEEESDNESVPSPVKPQPRVPYCKTYEEIRLEEIQAESAAYYSYQMEDQRGEAADDKAKIRRERKAGPYPTNGKEKNGEKSSDLDFKVLTLEEIRRKKRRKFTQDTESGSPMEASAMEDVGEPVDFLKDTVKTLAKLRKATGVQRGVKRVLRDDNDDNNRNNDDDEDDNSGRCKIRCNSTNSGFSGNAPPVKLRRSPKRFVSLGEADAGDSCKPPRVAEGERKRSSPANPGLERLNSSESTESASLGKRNEVEIRLCDSSTDEDQSQVEVNEEKKLAGAIDSKETCDSLLNVNEEDYLTLDMASDDILKDIDALLKEKNSV
nr:zinc finger CCCH domain-containing protein 11A-like isoform X2 [Megalopta genalis]